MHFSPIPTVYTDRMALDISSLSFGELISNLIVFQSGRPALLSEEDTERYKQHIEKLKMAVTDRFDQLSRS